MNRTLLLAPAVATLFMLGQRALPIPSQPLPASTDAPFSRAPFTPSPTSPQTSSVLPTPTPTPTPTPLPKIWAALYPGGSAYGVYLVDDPIDLWCAEHASTYERFSYLDGGAAANLELRVTGARGVVIEPLPSRSAPPHIVMGNGPSCGTVPLSAWGYRLRAPGRYHIAYSLNAAAKRLATANGFTTDAEASIEVRVVRQYSDVDPHLFPPPAGWRTGLCLADIGRVTTRANSESESLARGLLRGKQGPAGVECFRVFRLQGPFEDGLQREHALATGPGATSLSHVTVACGSEEKTILTYRLNAPQTHVQAVLLKMSAGYIVARYERPDAAPDDPGALYALDAPCRLL